jgi:hypothetical protein
MADSIDNLPVIDNPTLVQWVADHPRGVYALALAVGLSQEKLKNLMRSEFGTASWMLAANNDANAVVSWMDGEFNLIASLNVQRLAIGSPAPGFTPHCGAQGAD